MARSPRTGIRGTALGSEGVQARRGPKMVRAAADFVLLCRTATGAHTALAQVRARVATAGRTLPPTQTRIVNASAAAGFDFLGYHFERGLQGPRAKCLAKLRERLRQKTRRRDGRSIKRSSAT